MAEIKVQRKPAGAWWLWLIGLLVVLGLIWWFVARTADDGSEADTLSDAAVAGDPALPAGATQGAGEPITQVATLVGGQDQTLVGREVRLDGVRVQEMVGDAAFWIGTSADQRVLVILDEQIPSPPPSVEGRVNVNAGQTVDIRGRVRAADDLPPADGLEARERAAVTGQQVYIWAETAEVATPESAVPAGPPGR